MLTLKTKEFFFKYILEKYNYTESDFYQLPLVCQQALVVEFFDSVGIYVNAIKYPNPKNSKNEKWGAIAINHLCFKKSRPEALSKAIEKADELFNLNNE